jgi:hypothetical protein
VHRQNCVAIDLSGELDGGNHRPPFRNVRIGVATSTAMQLGLSDRAR